MSIAGVQIVIIEHYSIIILALDSEVRRTYKLCIPTYRQNYDIPKL